MSNSIKIELNNIKRNEEKTAVSEKPYKPGVCVIFFAEVLGTGMLMFLGCMGVCVPKVIDLPANPFLGGFSFGLTVLIVIQCLGHISSAHLNPQVTMASVILGKVTPLMSVVYFAAEFVGAVLGFGLLKLVTPPEYTTNMCVTMPFRDLTPIQAVIIEVAITCVLILACGSVWDDRNSDKLDSIPLRFGFIVTGISIVAGPLTGASMNTARTFAPALIDGNWQYQWVYWLGPTLGALIGALFYRYVLSAPRK